MPAGWALAGVAAATGHGNAALRRGVPGYARSRLAADPQDRAPREPAVQFDVVLNAMQYRTPAAIARTMRRLRTKLEPDGWFFDFLDRVQDPPRMVKAAIGAAHANGEWIGGNVFGLAKPRPLPARADFYSVQDAVFHLNLPAVRRLAARKPVVYHLNSKPHARGSGGCRFIERLNSARRRALIRRRAASRSATASGCPIRRGSRNA